MFSLLALTANAFGWTAQTVPGTDVPVWWGTMPLEYTFVDDADLPDDADDAVRAAFQAWSDVDGAAASFDALARPGAVPVAAHDDQQVVFLAQGWSYGSEALAVAAVWSDAQTGELMHFDVRLNGDVTWSTDGMDGSYDLESALTHEVGHVLGLDHSDRNEATMFAELDAGHVRRGLHLDDEEGLRFLYPESLEATGTSCSTAPGLSASWVLLAVFGLRRRR